MKEKKKYADTKEKGIEELTSRKVLVSQIDTRLNLPEDIHFDDVCDLMWQEIMQNNKTQLKKQFESLLADKFYFKLKNQELKKKVKNYQLKNMELLDQIQIQSVSIDRLAIQQKQLRDQITILNQKINSNEDREQQLKEKIDLLLFFVRKHPMLKDSIPQDLCRYFSGSSYLNAKQKNMFELPLKSSSQFQCGVNFMRKKVMTDGWNYCPSIDEICRPVIQEISRQFGMIMDVAEQMNRNKQINPPSRQLTKRSNLNLQQYIQVITKTLRMNSQFCEDILQQVKEQINQIKVKKNQRAKLLEQLEIILKQKMTLQFQNQELLRKLAKSHQELEKRQFDERYSRLLDDFHDKMDEVNEKLELKDVFQKQKSMQVMEQKVNYVNYLHEQKHVVQQKVIAELTDRIKLMINDYKLLQLNLSEEQSKCKELGDLNRGLQQKMKHIKGQVIKIAGECQMLKKRSGLADEWGYLQFLLKQLEFNLRTV